MISNYHDLKEMFLSGHSLIAVQRLETNCQTRETGDLTSFKLTIS